LTFSSNSSEYMIPSITSRTTPCRTTTTDIGSVSLAVNNTLVAFVPIATRY
jgi:hypothetical protein